MSFVLVAAELFHSVLDSIFMFAGLLSGQAGYTWVDWRGPWAGRPSATSSAASAW